MNSETSTTNAHPAFAKADGNLSTEKKRRSFRIMDEETQPDPPSPPPPGT